MGIVAAVQTPSVYFDLFGLTLRHVEIPLQIGDSSPVAQMSDHVWRVPQSNENLREKETPK